MSLKQCLIVLGMHRSGTSALTGVLAKLGIMTGNNLWPGHDQFNPKGFWEHADIVTIHEELLLALDSSWHDCRPLPAEWWKSQVSTSFKARIKEVISRDFSGSPLWVLKDPRICRLLPLWLDLLGELNCAARFLVILRNPAEVAASLAKRDDMPIQRGSMLWLQHVFDSEHWTRGQTRSLITFENLLADWRSVISTVEHELSLPLNMDDMQAAHAIDEFLEPRLRHNVVSDMTEPAGPAPDIAASCYKLLTTGGIDAGLSPDFHALKNETAKLLELIAPWEDQLQNLYIPLKKENKRLSDQLGQLGADITRIKNTYSWRITKPLRAINWLGRRFTG